MKTNKNREISNNYYGFSSDIKPKEAAYGSSFFEEDTNKVYYKTNGSDNNGWVEGVAASSTAENVSVGESSDVVFDISVGSDSAPSSPYSHLTESHLLYDGKEDAYMQGGWFKDVTSGTSTTRQFPVVSVASGSNLTNGTSAIAWAASFKVEGAFSFRVDGYDAGLPLFIVEVDGVDYSLINNNNVGVGRRWMTVDAGPGVHYIKVKGSLVASWKGYRTAPNALAEPWDVNRTSFYFGDSFTASTGASHNSLGYVFNTAIGVNHNLLLSASGGSGYVLPGNNGYKLSDRIISDYTNMEATNGVPNEVVIAFGLNDIGQAGIEAAADLAYDNLRTVYSGKVYVIGPWDTNAPSSPVTNYATAKTAIKNALVGREGFYFIDVQGVSFTKSDGTHPDNAGHAVLGAYVKKSLYPVPNTDMLRYSERIASQVPFTAVGNISSTNVQDAINEVGNKNYILLTSPDETVYRITVANGGTLNIVEE